MSDAVRAAVAELVQGDQAETLARLLAGLADRPSPGDKARAREAARKLLGRVGRLRRAVDAENPAPIYGSST